MNLYYIMWNYINNQCQIFTKIFMSTVIDEVYLVSFQVIPSLNEPIFEPQIQSTEMYFAWFACPSFCQVTSTCTVDNEVNTGFGLYRLRNVPADIMDGSTSLSLVIIRLIFQPQSSIFFIALILRLLIIAVKPHTAGDITVGLPQLLTDQLNDF